jgi:hypothetical protein
MIYEDVCLENVPLKRGKKRKIIHTPNDFFLSAASHSQSPPAKVKMKSGKKPLKAEP